MALHKRLFRLLSKQIAQRPLLWLVIGFLLAFFWIILTPIGTKLILMVSQTAVVRTALIAGLLLTGEVLSWVGAVIVASVTVVNGKDYLPWVKHPLKSLRQYWRQR